MQDLWRLRGLFQVAVSVGLITSACFPPALEQDVDSTPSDDTTDADDLADTPDISVPEMTEPTDTAEVSDLAPDVDVTEVEETTTPDAEVETDTETEVTPTLNACGGEGMVTPGQPGTSCGPCEDGQWVCDPGDATRRTTVCDGASALNPCGACGELDRPLDTACDECGVVACPGGGQPGTVCRSPTSGCGEPLTCIDLGCTTLNRTCQPETAVDDAVCLGCLSGFVPSGQVCVVPPNACGGQGPVVPAEPGTSCGPCNDGNRVCDTSDPNKRSTICQGASALNACGTCGVLDRPLNQACGDCGTVDCPAGGGTATICREPSDGCDEPETCSDLGCSLRNRQCQETDGVDDAVCLGCSPGYEPAGDACVVPLNACGGVGAISPGEPGASCGPCLDGVLVCNPGDPDKRSTFCANASVLNACNTCGVLDRTLGALCDECGVVVCAANGAPGTACSSPPEGCEVPLTCADLQCASQSRVCIESDGEDDAACGGCVPGHALVEGLCLAEAGVPGGLEATTDRVNDLRLTWNASSNATGYNVSRCTTNCSLPANWTVLTTSAIAATSYTDATTSAPGLPAAPVVTATQNLTTRVDVSWGAVSAPLAPVYQYRVTAIGPAGETAPSATAQGHRAERPVVGYELQLADGAWTAVAGGLVTAFSDVEAQPATLDPGTATASQGTFADFVRLSVTGQGTIPGATRSYRVRATTDYGPGPASASATGRRVSGAVTLQWERSGGAEPTGFTALSGATTASFDDVGAPADGSVRYYRVIVSATGAEPVTGLSVAGSRQPPPGIPAAVAATSDLRAVVRVTWTGVSEATGYHIYRNGTRVTTTPVVCSSSCQFDDTGAGAPTSSWSAPNDAGATTNNTAHVTVSWKRPIRPLGPVATYRVSAVNAAGEGPQSAEATGRRAEPALVGFEVVATPSNGTPVTTNIEDVTTWNDTSATKATITVGTLRAYGGDHRAFARVEATEVSVGTAPDVTYRVRGRLSDSSFTPQSSTASGRLATGALSYQWQRSAADSNSNHGDISCASETCNDDGAPATGERRYYRVVLSAPGATTRTSNAIGSWRLAFVGLAVQGSSILQAVAATCARTALVPDGGRVWCWGANNVGQLGLGFVGANREAPTRISGLTDVVELAPGQDSMCARSSAGAVLCWGNNGGGQLGDGTGVNRMSPTLIANLTAKDLGGGFGHGTVCAATTSSEGRCWGGNFSGQLGNGTTTDSFFPVPVRTSSSALLGSIQTIDSEGSLLVGHSCALRSGGVWCWGYNLYGQIGRADGVDSPWAIQVPGLSGVTGIATGGDHTCVRTENGQVRCFGRNSSGQLGNGNTTDSASPVQVSGIATASSVDASLSYSCALLATGALRCWGSNSDGVLGNGTQTSSSTPVNVSTLTSVDDDVPGTYSLAASHACAVQGGDVYCWGKNHTRQLGDGTTTTRTSPTLVVFP